MTSSNEVRKDKSAAVITENLICGSVTSMKALKREAPRLRAAISWLMS